MTARVLRTVERGTDWRDLSACADEDPDLFFPAGNPGDAAGAAHNAQIEAAKAVCGRCPVLDQCRRWATDTDAGRQAAQWAVVGGLSPDENRTVLKRSARARQRAAALAASAS